MLTENNDLLCQAVALNDSRCYTNVLEKLSDELLKQLNNAALYAERARACYNLGQYDNQLSDCRMALGIDAGYYKTYIYFGNYLLQKFEYEQAVANYTKAIKLNSECAEAYNNRGAAYLRSGNFDLAKQDFKKAVKLNSQYADALNNLGCLWYNCSDFDNAIENFTNAIKVNSADARVYYNRALAWLYKKELGNALADFDNAIGVDSLFSQAYFERGRTWLTLQNQARALEDFTRAIDIDKDFPHGLAHFERGNIWFARKEYYKALADHSEAIRINPHLTEAYNNKGLANHAVQDYSAAIENFTKAIAADRNYTAAYYNRGLAWMDKNDNDHALQDFDRVLVLDGYTAIAYYRRGVLWRSRKEYDKAIEDFNSCLERDASLHAAYGERGRAWFAKNDIDKALQDCNTALSYDPAFADALYTRGLIFVKLKEFDRALNDFNKAVQYNPRIALGYKNRGLLHYAHGEHEKALADFAEFIALEPGDARGYASIGAIWYNWKKYDSAINWYTKAIEIDNNFADAYCKRGNAFFAMKKYEEALADFEKALQLDSSLQFLEYNIDIARSRTGRHVKVYDVSGVKTFYFTENLIQALPPKEAAAIKKILFSIVDAADAIKEYAAKNTGDVDALYYYTNLRVADVLVMNKNSKLPYFNAVAQLKSDDNVLLQYVIGNDTAGVAEAFNGGRELGESNIYIGCFAPAAYKTKINGNTRLTADNNLPGWKLHPRNSNDAMAECGLVIKTGFFGQNDDFIYLDEEQFCLQSKARISANSNEQLYRVLYYDSNAGTIHGDTTGEVARYMDAFRQGLWQLVSYRSSTSGSTTYTINKIVYRLVSEIQYLFRDAAFASENELRIIEYVAADDARIKTENTDELPRNLYIESSKPLHPHLFEVVLGPTVQNPERWTYLGVHMKRNKYVGL